jgi:hypothetical protein
MPYLYFGVNPNIEIQGLYSNGCNIFLLTARGIYGILQNFNTEVTEFYREINEFNALLRSQRNLITFDLTDFSDKFYSSACRRHPFGKICGNMREDLPLKQIFISGISEKAILVIRRYSKVLTQRAQKIAQRALRLNIT